MNILITGGAGFIGSNLAVKLLEKNHNVTVLDCLSPQIHGENPSNSSLYKLIEGKVTFIKGSVTNKQDILKAIVDNEVIVHFAAETGTGQSMYRIHHYANVNVNGTALLLDILVNEKHSVKKVVVASSRAIYGEGKYFSEEFGVVYPLARNKLDLEKGNFEVCYPGSITPLQLCATDEESKIHPSSVYGITKQNQEQMVMTVCKSSGIGGVSLRYQNVYGPGQSLSNPYTGILSIFSTLIRNRRPINIFEDGKESRDFVFVNDAVNATILAIEKEEANGNIYNVGSGVPVDVFTVAQTLCNCYNTTVALNVTKNFRIGDIRHNYADISKIRNHLGFEPEFNFEKGVTLFTDWVKTQPIIKSEYDTSIVQLKERGLYK